jgi:hypothetical protein
MPDRPLGRLTLGYARFMSRYLRIAAWLVLLTWIPWESTSEAPAALLFLAFASAWYLLVDFLIHLPRDLETLRRGKRERMPAWKVLAFFALVPAGIALLVFSDEVAGRLFGALLLLVSVGRIVFAFGAAFREIRRQQRES